MIYTLTLNPALIHTYHLESFSCNEPLDVQKSRTDFKGNGLNVSLMLNNLQTANIATGLVGGHNGHQLELLLQNQGIDTLLHPISDDTRSCIQLYSKADQNQQMAIREPCPEITDDEVGGLLSLVTKSAQLGDWWVLTGELPAGLPPDTYQRLIKIIHSAGGYTLIDSCGDALKLACQASPNVVKLNLKEALVTLNLPAETQANKLDIARAVQALGTKAVVLSLGAEGAVLATEDRLELHKAPLIQAKDSTGAGDSMVAGLVWGLSQKHPMEFALRFGMACGAATAAEEGSQLGALHDIQIILGEMETQDH